MSGGSFAPFPLGHLALARAAARHFALARVYFVPAGMQPLKAKQRATHFYHRYAMLTLALAGEPGFVPSLLEAPEIVRASGQPASYTVDTVARVRARLKRGTQLYFLIGIDAFEQVAQWRSATELLRSTEFIVASRPGYSLRDVARALPAELRPDDAGAAEVVPLGMPLLADDDHVVAEAAPFARELGRGDGRAGAPEEVPVRERDLQGGGK